VWSLRERRLGARLDREFEGCGVVLHSRHSGPGLDCQPIDHLLVSSAGVWVIRADHSLDRLTLGDATVMVGACEREATKQVAATRSALSAIGFDWLDVQVAVCATNAEGVLRRPLRVDDIWVTRRGGLLSLLLRPGPLTHSDVATVASELSRRFPAAR